MTAATFRPAVPGDAEAIAALLDVHAEKGLLLKRSPDDIRSRIQNFIVAELDGQIVGCAALRDFREGLYEVRSLAVDQRHMGRGLGTELVRRAVAKVPPDVQARVFALTYRPNIFRQLGFRQVDKQMFPEKVWHDCSACPKKDACDEIAMILEVHPSPEPTPPSPPPPASPSSPLP